MEKDSGLIKFTLRRRRLSNSDLKPSSSIAVGSEILSTNGGLSTTAHLSGYSYQAQFFPATQNVDDDNLPQVTEAAKVMQEEVGKEAENRDTEQMRRKQMISECNKDNSIESNESVMDQSQSSTSTSSSSVMSIKSIVSLRNHRKPVNSDDGDGGREQEPKDPMAVDIAEDSGTREGSPPSEQLDDNESELMAKLARTVKRQPGSKSVVGETARRLEEAALANSRNKFVIGNLNQQKQPVAAIRTNKLPPGKISSNELNSQEAIGGAGQMKEEVMSGAINERIEKEAEIIAPIPNYLPVSKRSICWPPKQQQSNRNDAKSDKDKYENCEPNAKIGELNDGQDDSKVVGRVTANRLSFQKIIEENNNVSCGNFATLKSSFEAKLKQQPSRPTPAREIIKPIISRNKPQPPAKPRNLVAAKVSKFDSNEHSR